MTEALINALKTIPNQPGVYRMLDSAGVVMYVGKARSLSKRVASYVQLARLPRRLQQMVLQISTVEITTTETESKALLLEASTIKKLQPRYNILLKDGKLFPYILILKDHEFPRILKYRGAKHKNASYFGPFSSAGIIGQTISQIQKAFLIRNCSDNIFQTRSRPCLQYQIKRCTAPCVGLVSTEEYADQIKMAERFLSGESRSVQDELAERMQAASLAENFEEAAKYRDRIRGLTLIQSLHRATLDIDELDIIAIHRESSRSCIQVYTYRGGLSYGNQAFYPRHDDDSSDAEVMLAFINAYYENTNPPKTVVVNIAPEEQELLEDAYKIKIIIPQRGDKADALNVAVHNAKQSLERKLLENSSVVELHGKLAEIFNLSEAPERIEVYDNSHIMGTNQVGGMIVATTEGFDKKSYRKFNIRESHKGDDFAMMAEVLRRRFSNPETVMPDLVLIDGGVGQLGVAEKIFAELGISDVPLLAISKGENRNAGDETFHMLAGAFSLKLPKNSPVLFYLQRLRDEAHRYAIGSHRKKRAASMDTSELDLIPGIGASRRRALLKYFGSLKSAKEADIDELIRVPGISRKIAEDIYNYFHN